LEATFGKGELRFKALVPSDLMRFISDRARTCTPRLIKVIASSLRSYLRFLSFHELCKHNLVAAVPTIPQWRLSELPPSLTDKDVTRLLASFDCKTGTGKRDYAIALCLAHLGLRGCDVPLILLESIDWRAGTLRIPSSKTRREILLPLLKPVGGAIAAYLRGGRPKTADQHLFVRHRAPLGRSITPHIVRWIIRRAAERANVCLPRSGPHILRHTVATRMLQRGATLKDIADVLGHQCLDTTAVYAKVDLPTLQKVAMPWPEVRHA
jgi:site-specific recombinase XerD